MIEEVVLREPLTEFTAVVVVDVYPGNLYVIESGFGGGLGRPDITGDSRQFPELVTTPQQNGKDPQ